MSFLFPSMLWGLFALLIPIIVHLFSLRKNRKIEFSSIQHIKAIKKESIRKIKLLQWMVMLLRMGIISSLVIMGSGPIVKNQSSWIPSQKESLAVIIVDNSASMAVKDNNKSFLDDASDKVYKIISSFDGLVNLNVFQTSPPKLIFSGNIDKGSQINYQNWDFEQSIGEDRIWTFTDSVLKTFDLSLPNKECFLISDFPVIPPSNFKDEFFDWKFYFLGQDELKNNIGITDISSINKIKLPNELIKLNTRIENMGVVDRRNVNVEIYDDVTSTVTKNSSCDGSGGSSNESGDSNYAMIHTQIANAPEAFAQIGNLKFRYNSTGQNGFIEVKTLDSGEHMQVYCSLKRSSWDPGGSNHIENYHNDASYNNSTWNPLIKLWENDAWDGRVTLSSYKVFEGTMFTMGSGGAPPEPKSYRFFANIDGYNNVFIKVEYHE